jgi:hypothetical protein
VWTSDQNSLVMGLASEVISMFREPWILSHLCRRSHQNPGFRLRLGNIGGVALIVIAFQSSKEGSAM